MGVFNKFTRKATSQPSRSPSSAPSTDVEDPEKPVETSNVTPVNKETNGELQDVQTANTGVAEEQEEEDDTDYPKSFKLALVTTALCLSVFCMALDNTIIATAIPKITDDFKAIDDVGWYGSAYLLTTCAFQLFFGKLYTFLNLKWVYVVAIVIFEVGSFLCGISPNSIALIIGRAVAGVGSAGIFSGAILIVANTVPLKKRPIYTGIIGGMYGLGKLSKSLEQ